MEPFTSRLKSLDTSLFESATQHPFLLQAGKGTVSPSALAAWLVQDELYQHAYIPFIGQLLSKLRAPDYALPSTIFASGPAAEGEKVENDSLPHRLTDAFVSAIQALRVEETFFATTMRDYGLKERAKPSEPVEGTAAYLRLFEEVGSKGSLLDGLTLLWTTEYVYLNAWKFAGSHVESGAKGAVAEKFVPNWTSEEFEGFVDQLGGLLDEVAERQGGDLTSAEKVWKRALECEVGFWPSV